MATGVRPSIKKELPPERTSETSSGLKAISPAPPGAPPGANPALALLLGGVEDFAHRQPFRPGFVRKPETADLVGEMEP